jgi:hypothetical protein
MIGELLKAIINSTHDISTFTILKPLLQNYLDLCPLRIDI